MFQFNTAIFLHTFLQPAMLTSGATLQEAA